MRGQFYGISAAIRKRDKAKGTCQVAKLNNIHFRHISSYFQGMLCKELSLR